MLVVCEGQKTEPEYVRDLCRAYRLGNAKVVGTGLDPMSIVNLASNKLGEAKRDGEPYDAVFCVFDRDSHVNFDQASQTARDRGIRLARSWPCFEFWLLLHFVKVTKPYSRAGDRSACQCCIDDLRKRLPHYEKKASGLFDALSHRLGCAKSRAATVLAHAKLHGNLNPSTEVHELVDYLQKI